MRVLVACEFSGIVRDAFRDCGHIAISCDLLPTERKGYHVQGDVRPILQKPWDLVIAHPPCTYLCNSGVRWLHEPSTETEQWERWKLLGRAAHFFLQCLNANAPRVAVENPVMHKYAKELIGGEHSFSIQPWQFGHGEVKRTCFWTRGLPKLKPTNIVAGRRQRVATESPSPDRWKERSRFLPGIAKAMAEQWGGL